MGDGEAGAISLATETSATNRLVFDDKVRYESIFGRRGRMRPGVGGVVGAADTGVGGTHAGSHEGGELSVAATTSVAAPHAGDERAGETGVVGSARRIVDAYQVREDEAVEVGMGGAPA